jgi:hypothetical protein
MSRDLAGRVFIGTSGYVYPHWRGRFNPGDLPAKSWFEYYAHHFQTVELNNPFYRLPTAPPSRHGGARPHQGSSSPSRRAVISRT